MSRSRRSQPPTTYRWINDPGLWIGRTAIIAQVQHDMREALLLQSRESLLQVLGDPLAEPSNPDVHHCRARQVLPGDIVDGHTLPYDGHIAGLFGVGIKESQRDGGPPGASDPLHNLLQWQPSDGLLVDL